jgi:hypothetical protein
MVVRVEMTKKRVISRQLIRADVVDGNGDLFTREALEKMVKGARCDMGRVGRDIWAFENFSGKTADIQGRLVGLTMGEDGADAEVEIIDTPAGRNAMRIIRLDEEIDKGFCAIAAGGSFSHDDTTTEKRDGRDVRVIHKVVLEKVSILPKKDKVQ